MLCLIFYSVHATCLVFSSGLSVGHFRHHYPIGGMEIQQIHKTHFCSRFWHIIFHTSHYHVSKSIRRNLHGHTRVRFIQTKYPSIWPKQMGEKENKWNGISDSQKWFHCRKTRYAHWYDEQYQKAYIPFYTNMSSFSFGMIAGLLYCKHKQGHIDLAKSRVGFKPFDKYINIWFHLISVDVQTTPFPFHISREKSCKDFSTMMMMMLMME